MLMITIMMMMMMMKEAEVYPALVCVSLSNLGQLWVPIHLPWLSFWSSNVHNLDDYAHDDDLDVGKFTNPKAMISMITDDHIREDPVYQNVCNIDKGGGGGH